MPKGKVLKKDGCTQPIKWLSSGNLVAGIAGVIIYPTSFPRALQEADAWDYFRLLSLKFRLIPPTTTPTSPQIVGYVPGVQDTPPNSQANVAELINSTVMGARQTVPSNWVSVPRKELAGPFPWYKSIPGTTDPTEEIPGAIYIAGNSTDNFLVEFALVFEYKSSVATNNTPAAVSITTQLRSIRVKAARDRRRSEILALLGNDARSLIP